MHVLAIRKAALPAGHPKIGDTYNNMAGVLEKQDKLDKLRERLPHIPQSQLLHSLELSRLKFSDEEVVNHSSRHNN